MDAFFAIVVAVLVFVLFAELSAIGCLLVLMRKPAHHHAHGHSEQHPHVHV